MKYLISIPLIIASALLYRIGGMGKEDSAVPVWVPKWIRNTKVRDVGCPLLGWVYMFVFAPAVPWWIHSIAGVLTFGALTTYWDKLFNDVDNFYMHGAMIGLAYFLYGNIAALVIRIAVCALVMGWINYLVNKKHLPIGGAAGEEMSRGAVMQATLLLY